MPKKFIKPISLLLCFCFFFTQTGLAQLLPFQQGLSPQGTVPVVFQLPVLRYLSVNTANPSNYFNFLMDKGNMSLRGDTSVIARREAPKQSQDVIASPSARNDDLNAEATKLIHYFFLGLTLPSEAFWVNLKPQEPERITSEELSKTDLGRTLLEQDLKLKKDVARYLHPKHPQGKLYWEKLYAAIGKDKAKKATITSSSRVWIVPAEAVVLETEDGALVAKATLKVLLESEYLSLRKQGFLGVIPRLDRGIQSGDSRFRGNDQEKELQSISENLMKEIILPSLTKDINESPGYAPLRQIYHSLILAEWYKRKQGLSPKGTVPETNPYSKYINSGTTQGLESALPWEKQAIWQEYLKSYQEGEYKLQDTIFGLKRMYFSGGMELTKIGSAEVMKVIPFSSGSPILNNPEIRNNNRFLEKGLVVVNPAGTTINTTDEIPIGKPRIIFPESFIKENQEALSPAPLTSSVGYQKQGASDKQTVGSPLKQEITLRSIEDENIFDKKISRRNFLKWGLTAVLATAGTLTATSTEAKTDKESYGEFKNGENYRKFVTENLPDNLKELFIRKDEAQKKKGIHNWPWGKWTKEEVEAKKEYERLRDEIINVLEKEYKLYKAHGEEMYVVPIKGLSRAGFEADGINHHARVDAKHRIVLVDENVLKESKENVIKNALLERYRKYGFWAGIEVVAMTFSGAVGFIALLGASAWFWDTKGREMYQEYRKEHFIKSLLGGRIKIKKIDLLAGNNLMVIETFSGYKIYYMGDFVQVFKKDERLLRIDETSLTREGLIILATINLLTENQQNIFYRLRGQLSLENQKLLSIAFLQVLSRYHIGEITLENMLIETLLKDFDNRIYQMAIAELSRLEDISGKGAFYRDLANKSGNEIIQQYKDNIQGLVDGLVNAAESKYLSSKINSLLDPLAKEINQKAELKISPENLQWLTSFFRAGLFSHYSNTSLSVDIGNVLLRLANESSQMKVELAPLIIMNSWREPGHSGEMPFLNITDPSGQSKLSNFLSSLSKDEIEQLRRKNIPGLIDVAGTILENPANFNAKNIESPVFQKSHQVLQEMYLELLGSKDSQEQSFAMNYFDKWITIPYLQDVYAVMKKVLVSSDETLTDRILKLLSYKIAYGDESELKIIFGVFNPEMLSYVKNIKNVVSALTTSTEDPSYLGQPIINGEFNDIFNQNESLDIHKFTAAVLRDQKKENVELKKRLLSDYFSKFPEIREDILTAVRYVRIPVITELLMHHLTGNSDRFLGNLDTLLQIFNFDMVPYAEKIKTIFSALGNPPYFVHLLFEGSLNDILRNTTVNIDDFTERILKSNLGIPIKKEFIGLYLGTTNYYSKNIFKIIKDNFPELKEYCLSFFDQNSLNFHRNLKLILEGFEPEILSIFKGVEYLLYFLPVQLILRDPKILKNIMAALENKTLNNILQNTNFKNYPESFNGRIPDLLYKNNGFEKFSDFCKKSESLNAQPLHEGNLLKFIMLTEGEIDSAPKTMGRTERFRIKGHGQILHFKEVTIGKPSGELIREIILLESIKKGIITDIGGMDKSYLPTMLTDPQTDKAFFKFESRDGIIYNAPEDCFTYITHDNSRRFHNHKKRLSVIETALDNTLNFAIALWKQGIFLDESIFHRSDTFRWMKSYLFNRASVGSIRFSQVRNWLDYPNISILGPRDFGHYLLLSEIPDIETAVEKIGNYLVYYTFIAAAGFYNNRLSKSEFREFISLQYKKAGVEVYEGFADEMWQLVQNKPVFDRKLGTRGLLVKPESWDNIFKFSLSIFSSLIEELQKRQSSRFAFESSSLAPKEEGPMAEPAIAQTAASSAVGQGPQGFVAHEIASPSARNDDINKGGIDLSQIELTLKDDKYISSLNPADIKILRAAKALKEEWNSLSLLYIHELILLFKDNLASDIQNKNLLSQVLQQLQSQKFLDPQAIQFFKLIQANKPLSEVKLALYQ